MNENTTKMDIAWAAGFFDGEGCIYHPPKAPHATYIYLAQKEIEALEIFRTIVGFGKIYNRQKIKTPYGGETHSYTYYVGGVNGGKVLETLLPYLVVKQSQAQEALRRRSKIKGWNWDRNKERDNSHTLP